MHPSRGLDYPDRGGMAKMEIPANRFRHNCLGDSGQISGGLPAPVFPRWELIPELIVPALSLASVGLSVSAGISQTYLVKIRIFEVAQLADGRYEERATPTEIPSGKTTILVEQYGEHGKQAQRSRRGLIAPRSRFCVRNAG